MARTASAAIAAKDLLMCKCKAYAYLGTGKNMHWDKARPKRFFLRRTGMTMREYRRQTCKYTAPRVREVCRIA